MVVAAPLRILLSPEIPAVFKVTVFTKVGVAIKPLLIVGLVRVLLVNV